MSVTHPTAVRTAVADFIVDQLDAGAGPGTIEFRTGGGTEVATLTFDDPAFGAASAGVATAGTITDDTNATGGTIAIAVMLDSDSNEIFRCSVTATGGGGDIELTSVVVAGGGTVSLTSLTYEAMP
jgi:hypothetical protein